MGSLRISAFLLLLPVFGLLSGCALETTADSSSITGSAISGTIFGGQQPIGQAHVYLFAVGTGPYGTASTSLLKSASTGHSDAVGAYVLTSNTGSFTVSGDYTCPTPATPVYLYSLGGTPETQSLGPNALASFIIGLGPCGSAGSSVVSMNEVTTVATAYALAGFATDATHIASSGSALALTGLANAMSTIGNIVNTSTGVARATTIAGNGTVPAATINTLANILASCVNTNGALIAGTKTTTASNCYTLVNNAASTGTSGTAAPETATAAINIAHYPAAAVATLFALQPGIGAPNVGLAAQPSDFTLSIAYTGGGMVASFDSPDGLAVDASGNIWATTGNGTVLSKFNTLGVSANTGGYTGLNLYEPSSVTVDATSSNVWISNYGNSDVVKFNISGGTGSTYSTGIGTNPDDVAFDTSGNAIITDVATNSLYKMSSSGTGLVKFATGNGIDNPFATVIGNNGYIWVASATNGPPNDSLNLFSSTGSALAASSAIFQAISVAMGANNTAYYLRFQNAEILKASYNGSALATTLLTGTGGGFNTTALKIDGAGNMWFTSYAANNNANHAQNGIFEMTSTGTVLSGTAGFLSPTAIEPNSLAIDQSGNVWFDSESDANLYELIGAAAPTAVPLAYAQITNLYASRP